MLRSAARLPTLALTSALLLASALSGCGAGHARKPRSPSAAAPISPRSLAPVAPARPAFGITEGNADLLWSPSDPRAPAATAFAPARAELSALHPVYVRLLINWAALQPDPARAPALTAPVSGCARETGPCGPYDGVAAELRAIASQRHAGNGASVVIDILGVPAWAAQGPHGCEQAGDGTHARALTPGAIAAYRALISGLIALAAREGVEIAWWSPWNEPNNARFLSPQRATCDAAGAPLAPAVYAQLTAAMSAELSAEHLPPKVLLGELAGYDTGSPHSLSVGEFVAALPAATICTGAAWSVHAYAARAPRRVGPDPVGLLETALDARGGCAARAPIWVTETGAGAPQPGRQPSGGAGEEHAACLALARLVLGWYSRPRVQAVLQYSFREDPAFPVGLLSADLRRRRATYEMWRVLTHDRAGQAAPPSATQACSSA